MTSNTPLSNNQYDKLSYLDIIYLDKNKSYGSYALRAGYGSTIRKSIMGMLGLCATLALFSFVSNRKVAVLPDVKPHKKDSMVVVKVNLDKKLHQPEKVKSNVAKANPRPNNPVARTIVPTIPLIVTTTTSVSPVATTSVVPSTTGPVTTGSTTGGFNPTGGGNGVPSAGGTGGGTPGGGTATTGKGIATAAGVDSEPEYPGGKAAIAAFLNNNLGYPEEEQQEGKEATITMLFVVNEDGSITQVHSDEKNAENFIAEGKRVLKLMPHWKPAMLGGKPVKCYFSLEIKYELN